MRAATFIAAAGLTALLAACGQGRDDATVPEVATVASGGPSGNTSPPAQQRPLIRTDTSPEERERLWNEYSRCLESQGLGTELERKRRSDASDPKVVAAEAACEGKKPETVWERAKRTDPSYADKLRDWVTCIRAHGIDAWESDGYLAFDSLPPDDQMKKVDECQDKAFGKG